MNELEGMWKEADVACCKGLPKNCPLRTERYPRSTFIILAGVQVEIRNATSRIELLCYHLWRCSAWAELLVSPLLEVSGACL
jgi:hypothetical protein